MQPVRRPPAPMEIGVMFWPGEEPAATLERYTKLGFRCGQLGIPGDLALDCAPAWNKALDEAGFTVYTVFAAFEGESYLDVPTVRNTVGFIPRATRAEREKRMFAVADLAAELGVASVATHIGCLPEDTNDPEYTAVRDLVRRVCEHTGNPDRRQVFALETGQESAASLMAFIRDVDRPNIGINFDPANMIMYGTGDPIEALGELAPRVVSVHCKDGEYPPENQPGALGTEVPLGRGKVGIPRFLRELDRVGYRGPLAIEREAGAGERMRDIAAGAEYLRELINTGLK
jgi:sugar phosphate isomerase/epimerase